MIANYHTHTPRCRHARGGEISYVENAIARGLKIFGFSDHTPQFFPGDYYSTMRMRPEQLQDYCDTVRALQARYKDHLQIPLGLEVEYYPSLFPQLIPQLRDMGIEYILLGQHWVGNEMDAPYSGIATADEKHLRRYCDQVIEAMETGLFTYLAHPELIHFKGDRKIYDHHMRRLCRAAMETNTPLEINLLGIEENRHYPNDAFWALAAEEGCDVILGIDAHCPEAVSNPQPEEKALQLAKKFSLHLLDTVPFKKL